MATLEEKRRMSLYDLTAPCPLCAAAMCLPLAMCWPCYREHRDAMGVATFKQYDDARNARIEKALA